jgi:hypothetical protein
MNWIFPQTSRGSFSAVSTPISSSKYSLESSRRDLHNTLLCTVLQTQNFSQKSPTFFRDWRSEILSFFIFLVKWLKFCILNFSANFWWNFVRISLQFPEKNDVCRFFNQICDNQLENCQNRAKQKFWNLWKLFNIITCSIPYHSFVSLAGPPAPRGAGARARRCAGPWARLGRFLRRVADSHLTQVRWPS